MPTVKKIIFQNGSQLRRTDAFTTALSKDKETSITAKIAVIVKALSMVDTPASGPWVKPQYADSAKHTTVKNIENRKCFMDQTYTKN